MTSELAQVLLILPIAAPFLSAVIALAVFRSTRAQRWVGFGGAVALFLAGGVLFAAVERHGILAVTLGGWPAPFGITLVADLFSAAMVAMTGFMGLAVAVYSLYDMGHRRLAYGFYPLYNILLMGVCGAFLTGDLFNLYVWFEVMLMASFVLLVLGGERPQMEGAVKYVTLNLLASVLFLSATGILYGKANTLNFAELALRLQDVDDQHVITAIALIFVASFGIKAGLFPLFFWLPAAYHTPPVAITTIFSALLTKVGVYALIRMFTLVFTQEQEFTRAVLMALAALTMITGVLGAVAQYDFRRLLSFHIISQIGYLIMGLAIGTKLALAATLYFMVHVILAKSALFLVSGIVHRQRDTYDLKILGGLYRQQPVLSALFLIAALALAGIPPFSGFFAKYGLVRAGLETEAYALVGAALGVSILTLFSMTKIWGEAFWKAAPRPLPYYKSPRRLFAPVLVMAALLVGMGLFAEPMMQLALRAAEQLLSPEGYIEAVRLHTP